MDNGSRANAKSDPMAEAVPCVSIQKFKCHEIALYSPCNNNTGATTVMQGTFTSFNKVTHYTTH